MYSTRVLALHTIPQTSFFFVAHSHSAQRKFVFNSPEGFDGLVFLLDEAESDNEGKLDVEAEGWSFLFSTAGNANALFLKASFSRSKLGSITTFQAIINFTETLNTVQCSVWLPTVMMVLSFSALRRMKYVSGLYGLVEKKKGNETSRYENEINLEL